MAVNSGQAGHGSKPRVQLRRICLDGRWRQPRDFFFLLLRSELFHSRYNWHPGNGSRTYRGYGWNVKVRRLSGRSVQLVLIQADSFLLRIASQQEVGVAGKKQGCRKKKPSSYCRSAQPFIKENQLKTFYGGSSSNRVRLEKTVGSCSRQPDSVVSIR